MMKHLTWLFVSLAHGKTAAKWELAILLAAFMTPITHFIEKFLFNDWEFLSYLLVLVCLDTIMGFWTAFVQKKISSSGFAKFFMKVIIYGVFLIVVHIVSKFTVDGNVNNLMGWFSTFAYTALIIRESLSILEKISSLYPDVIPDWILERFKKFDKSGNAKDLTGENTAH